MNSQGVPLDDSDMEWNASIASDFGTQGRGMLRDAARQIDADLDIEGLVRHAFQEYDEQIGAPHRDFPNFGDSSPDRDQGARPGDVEVDDNLFGAGQNNGDQTEFLTDRTSTPLFAGARLTWLTATFLILNLCRTHGCSNLFITELLTILANSILPEVNLLPKTEYEASKTLKKLGYAYDAIHVCPNTCILFRVPQHDNLDQCTSCGAPRYKRVGDSLVPQKVLRHFPLIARLKMIFKSPKQAAM